MKLTQEQAERLNAMGKLFVTVKPGDELEYRVVGNDDWYPSSAITEWRIKPAPRYRPFTAVEALKHEGRKVYWQKGGKRGRLQWFQESHVLIKWDDQGEGCWRYLAMAEDLVFTDDNTPCGVLEAGE